MIPYVPPRTFSIAGAEITGFQVLVLAAVVAGAVAVVALAPRAGMGRRRALALVLMMVVGGFLSSRLLALAMNRPELLARDPLEVFRVWASMSSVGGILGGFAGLWAGMRITGTAPAPRLAFLDTIAFVFPFSWMIGRLGCAWAHDHPGALSDHWLAVAYPGGARFDMGLVEAVYSAFIAGLFLFLARRERPAGFYVVWFALLYSTGRFFLDFLRQWDARVFGLTYAQWTCVGCVGVVVIVLARVYRLRPERQPAIPDTRA